MGAGAQQDSVGTSAAATTPSHVCDVCRAGLLSPPFFTVFGPRAQHLGAQGAPTCANSARSSSSSALLPSFSLSLLPGAAAGAAGPAGGGRAPHPGTAHQSL